MAHAVLRSLCATVVLLPHDPAEFPLATNSDPANAMAYEGATPLDGKDSDFEATPPGPTPEEIHALSVKALAESIARAQKERETKKADDAKLGGFDFA